MAQIYSNNAIARITAPFYSGGTTLHIDPARAPLFPQPQRLEDYFLVTLDDINDPDTYEILKISGRSGSALTVAARGYEGTTERSWTVADTMCDHRVTAGTLDSFLPCARINYKIVNQGSFRIIDQFNITTIFDGETVVSTWDNSPTDIRPLISINRLTSTPSPIQVEISNLMLGKDE